MEPMTVALRVPGQPDDREAERLARSAPETGSWGILEVEIIPGREETLLLIHPARGVYISAGAARILDRYRRNQSLTPP